MLVLLLPIAGALVGMTAYLVVSMVPPPTRVERWLALWIAVWAEIVLTAEVLSLLEAVTPLGFLLCYAVFAAVVLTIWLRKGRPRTRLLTLPARREVMQAARRHPVLALLIAVLALCAVVNLGLGLVMPVTNADALAYHLPRVAYWIQHGSTDHYFTNDPRQNMAPPNAEFGALSMVIFARAEWPTPLGQFAAYFICMAAVYVLARRAGASNPAALFAALLLGTMTEVVLQATVPKNGLIVTSFLVLSMSFLFRSLKLAPRTGDGERADPAWRGTLVWSAVALGLAIGTKATAVFFLPGFVIASALSIAFTGRPGNIRRGLAWAAFCLIAFGLFGAFNYARNYSHYGSLAGPKAMVSNERIERPNLAATVANLARYAYHQCDFDGLLPRRLASALTRIRARAAPPIFRALSIRLNGEDLNSPSYPKDFYVDKETGGFEADVLQHPDKAWFGPIAFFVGVPVVVAALVRGPGRGRPVVFALALAATLYWVLHCVLLRYSPWRGRFFLTAAVTAAPLLVVAYRPTRVRWFRHGATWLLAVIGVMTALAATFFNYYRPILPKPSVLRGAVHRQAFDLTAAAAPTLDAHFPDVARIGLVKNAGDCEWPLFGRGLKRQLTPLPLDCERIEEALATGEVNLVLVSKSIGFDRLPPVLGERPLSLTRAGRSPWHDFDGRTDGTWSFVLPPADGDDVLFPTRDWRPSRELWFGSGQGFVPARRLPDGFVALELRPGPIIEEGPLDFRVYAGDALVDSFSLSDGAPCRHRVRWPKRDEDDVLLLRIEVSSADNALTERLGEAAHVYRLLALPRFEESAEDHADQEAGE